MNLETLLQEQAQQSAVSSVANPFAKGNTQRVMIIVGRWCAGAPIIFQATIYVENGPTKGEHKVEGRDYPDLMARLSAVLASLQ